MSFDIVTGIVAVYGCTSLTIEWRIISMTHYQFSYVSKMVDDFTPSCVTKIVHLARVKNHALNIGSVLIFDGWRFFQYLEGNYDEVSALTDSIRHDHRHHQLNVLYEGASSQRQITQPGLEYALCYDDSLSCFEQLEGIACLDALRAMMPRLDLTS
jgi:hypothetical protein